MNRIYISFLVLLVLLLRPAELLARVIVLKGEVRDPQGNVLSGASLELFKHQTDQKPLARTDSGAEGHFQLQAPFAGDFNVHVNAEGFRAVTQKLRVDEGVHPDIIIRMTALSTVTNSVSVTADVGDQDVLTPDPAMRVFVRDDLLDANPGRPGAPVSIPGYPTETASGGIKAPQYFAPGVAGDHGEPIAQYLAVGGFLVPNNLSANAHGNGYADPNILVAGILESVQVDGGAFNVREGNHSVNVAAAYDLRSHLDPFLLVTGSYRDIDVAAGWSPSAESYLAFEAGYGNGFLDRLEHRQQYKFNAQRIFNLGEHRLTLFGLGYFGHSYLPGLVPICSATTVCDENVPNYGDSVDPRQKDQTHTGLIALNDVWQISESQHVQMSGFFRTYNLALYSNFGQGLIRQSEFRTVAGGSANYTNKVAEEFTLLAGFDSEREAPRRDDLDHYSTSFSPTEPGFYGPFTRLAGNNVTISSLTPYIATQGVVARHLSYYLGWRRDEININNGDLLVPHNSFQKWVGVNSPKATVAFLPKESWLIPQISLSFGQSFYTNDPRIGSASGLPGTAVSTAHSYQLVASKTWLHTDLKFTLGHVTSSQTLAKIDADNGLQSDEGPGRLRFMTLAVARSFRFGSFLTSLSKADARDLATGLPTPEAPRTIVDLLGTVQKLPWHLHASGEFEYVGSKPLGTGCEMNQPNGECRGFGIKEYRGAMLRPFLQGRMDVGVNLLMARGYSGQTTENFYSSNFPEVVGVRIPSYVSVSLTYRLGR